MIGRYGTYGWPYYGGYSPIYQTAAADGARYQVRNIGERDAPVYAICVSTFTEYWHPTGDARFAAAEIARTALHAQMQAVGTPIHIEPPPGGTCTEDDIRGMIMAALEGETTNGPSRV